MNYPEFTVVRATCKHKQTGLDVTAILIKIDNEWLPPGEETWWVEGDEELHETHHRVEVLARPAHDESTDEGGTSG